MTAKQFLGWLYSRRWALVCFAAVMAILFLVYGLYGYDWGVGLYTALLAAVACGLFAVADLIRYISRLKTLAKLPGAFPTGEVPEPGDTLEAAYTEVITALEAERVRLAGAGERRQRDADEYYTLWAHQIKTPIAALRLLLQREEDGPDRDLLELELFRIEQYVGMVLQYQRLTTIEGDLAFESHSVRAIVNKAVKGLAPLFIHKGLPLRLGDITGEVVTDEKWLAFVLEQLLTNALKYTEAGEVRVFSEGETLVVEDTGIGIAPEDLPRVFERGYTGAIGRSERSSTGLGLYLCRRILERLGFAITIESQPGQGTRVSLRLSQQALLPV